MAIDRRGDSKKSSVDTRSPEQKNRDAFRAAGTVSPRVAINRAAANATATSGASGSGGGSSDAVTAAQRAAAANLAKIASANAWAVRDEHGRAMGIYDDSDATHRARAGVQQTQHSRQAAGDRFQQNRKLQMATSNLRAAAGNALQGSGSRSLSDMLRTRTDIDNTDAFDTLRGNQDAVRDSLNEALNANVAARNEAGSKAEVALRGIESDTSAQLNNINPKLFAAPTKGVANFNSKDFAKKNRVKPTPAQVGGYITPANQGQYLTR